MAARKTRASKPATHSYPLERIPMDLWNEIAITAGRQHVSIRDYILAVVRQDIETDAALRRAVIYNALDTAIERLQTVKQVLLPGVLLS